MSLSSFSPVVTHASLSQVDMDNDGAMSLSEVKTAAGRLRSNAKMLFRNADRDGSASLEEPEVKMLLQIAGMKVTDDQVMLPSPGIHHR